MGLAAIVKIRRILLSLLAVFLRMLAAFRWYPNLNSIGGCMDPEIQLLVLGGVFAAASGVVIGFLARRARSIISLPILLLTEYRLDENNPQSHVVIAGRQRGVIARMQNAVGMASKYQMTVTSQNVLIRERKFHEQSFVVLPLAMVSEINCAYKRNFRGIGPGVVGNVSDCAGRGV